MKVHIEEKIVNSQIFIRFFLFLLFNKRKLSLVLFSAARQSLWQLEFAILAAMRRVGSVGIRSTVY